MGSQHRVRPDRGFVGSVRRGQDGRPMCRWCSGAVQRPRRTFCSDECIDQWKLRTQPGYLAAQTFARDHGVCQGCGVDLKGRSDWQADHKVPVALGGGECGLDNMQLLCRACHVIKTAEDRREIAKVKRNQQGSLDLM